MIREKDVIHIESGTWESENEVISRILDVLKENDLYKPDQIYRIQTTISERSIKKKVIQKAGNINPKSNLGPNKFHGCLEDQLEHYYDTLGANMEPFCYLVGYDPKKVDEVGSTIYQFKDQKNKKEALDFLVEIYND